jgi:hypothetical protein
MQELLKVIRWRLKDLLGGFLEKVKIKVNLSPYASWRYTGE